MKTHIADFLASFVGLILRSFQNGGELVLGPLILLPVPPLVPENNKKMKCKNHSVGFSSKMCRKHREKLSKITYLMREAQSGCLCAKECVKTTMSDAHSLVFFIFLDSF